MALLFERFLDVAVAGQDLVEMRWVAGTTSARDARDPAQTYTASIADRDAWLTLDCVSRTGL